MKIGICSGPQDWQAFVGPKTGSGVNAMNLSV